MDISILPSVNAALNLATAFFLVLGYTLIKQRAITGHTLCMVAATLTSTIFLASYLYYHAHHGVTRFEGHGFVRFFYFFILSTHTVLAAIQLPLILLTLYRAFRSQFDKHARIARITFPIWLYVSITGVIVYWMLYRVHYS